MVACRDRARDRRTPRTASGPGWLARTNEATGSFHGRQDVQRRGLPFQEDASDHGKHVIDNLVLANASVQPPIRWSPTHVMGFPQPEPGLPHFLADALAGIEMTVIRRRERRRIAL